MYAGVISSVEMLSRSLGYSVDPDGAPGSKGRSSPASCFLRRAGSSVRRRTRPSNRTRSATFETGRRRRLSIIVEEDDRCSGEGATPYWELGVRSQGSGLERRVAATRQTRSSDEQTAARCAAVAFPTLTPDS